MVDKPLIQYAVEEAVAAGAERLVFVTHSSKGAIQAHFDEHAELEEALADSGKQDILAAVRGLLPAQVSCDFVLQGDPLGLGHAVLCAKELVGDEPFFVHLPDDLILASTGCLTQLRDRYEQTGCSVIATEEVPPEKTSSYGIAAVDDEHAIREIVEKPAPEDAPSNLGVVGRYLLYPGNFYRTGTNRQGLGWRDSTDRRNCRPDAPADRLRNAVCRRALRLRQQARVFAGQYRFLRWSARTWRPACAGICRASGRNQSPSRLS